MKVWIFGVSLLLMLIAAIPQPLRGQSIPWREASPLVAATPAVASLFLWPEPINNTSYSSVAVDQNGGIHVALSAYTPSEGERPAYYATCSGDCADLSNWTIIPVGNQGILGNYVSLALTPEGHPRMVWYARTSLWENDGALYYAECNTACSNVSNWVRTNVVATSSVPAGTRYFALDPAGRPRFVFEADLNNQSGLYYAACDSDCTDSTNWRTTLISPGYTWFNEELIFNSAGWPRIATWLDDKVTYIECNQACTDAENWIATTLSAVENGSDSSFSLALDAQDRPRLAFYSGFLDSDNPQDRRLFYFWCNAQNCQAPTSWDYHMTGLPARHGHDVVMKLDQQGRPHLAYLSENLPIGQTIGLGYATCLAACETSAPSWQSQILETAGSLNTSNPIPIAPGYMMSSWLFIGERPSLALDPATGNVRITYDTSHWQDTYADVKLVRFSMLETNTTSFSIYLPTVIR
jgi:hypothetical protein